MRLKHKIPSFVFGITVGLLVGLSVFIFKLDTYLKKLTVNTTERVKIVEQTVNTSNDKAEKKEKQSNKKPTINTSKSPTINYGEVDALIRDEANIKIAKEELIVIKNIKLINLDKTPATDSLYTDLAGASVNQTPNLFFVEFWKTPLNSKGYRMTKNRILLYGFPEGINMTLHKLNDNYYLRADDVVYKVMPSSEFKSMERESDTNLLAKMN